MPFLLLHMCYFWAMLACFKLPYLPSASFACLTPKDWDCSARCWLSQKESRVLPLQNSAVILFKVCTIMQKLQFWLQRCCPTAVTGWVLAGMIFFFFLNSGGFLFWFDFPETGKVRLFLFHCFISAASCHSRGTESSPRQCHRACWRTSNQHFNLMFTVVFFKADSFTQPFTHKFHC